MLRNEWSGRVRSSRYAGRWMVVVVVATARPVASQAPVTPARPGVLERVDLRSAHVSSLTPALDVTLPVALAHAEVALTAAEPALEGLPLHLALVDVSLAQAAPALVTMRLGLVGHDLAGFGDEWWADVVQSPDSLYRAGREALNRGDYGRAAQLFQQLRRTYPRSEYVGDSYYWEAEALRRQGGSDNLRAALDRLREQGQRYPNAATRRDGDVLAARIEGELARLGDAAAAERVTREAERTARESERAARSRGSQEEDDDLQLAALNALLQMDADRAMPILEQVLQRRDAGSQELRKKAVFLVSQKRTPRTEEILLNAARSDPSSEVRAQAVFWLSQVPTERAVAALDSILFQSTDREVQEKAIFALSQQRSTRAGQALRQFAEREDVSEDLRGKAIFWLGQQNAAENQAYLRELYGRLRSSELKEKVIFSVSQQSSAESQRWLIDVALNPSEPTELRKKALFWAGQNNRVPIADLVRMYDTMTDRELKEQLIFVYSQRRDREAVDKLMDIVRRDPDPELKKKAVFWLGQSRDPRVEQFLLDIINNP